MVDPSRYLCKARKLKDGEVVIGYYRYITSTEEHCIMPYNPKNKNEQYVVDGNTICLCTGVSDNRGELIWENDVVAYEDVTQTESGCAEYNCEGKVVWDNETVSFQVTGRLSAESYEVLNDCMVIGRDGKNFDGCIKTGA